MQASVSELQHVNLVVVAHGLSFSAAYGIETMSSALQAGLLTTGPPGKP